MDYNIHISLRDHIQRSLALQELLMDIESTPDLESRLDEFYQSFRKIYIIEQDGKMDVYRHSYSSVFKTLINLAYDKNGRHDLDDFSEKIRSCLAYAHSKHKESDDEGSSRLRNCLYKLWDHISLDVARISQIDAVSGGYRNDLQDLRATQEQQIKQASKDIQRVGKNIQNIKIDVVAILGIFSAIIIGLVSSTAFSSQILAHAHELSSGNVMIAVSLCGFVTISVFWLVFLLLSRIIFPETAGLSKAGNWFLTGAGVVLFTLFVAGLLTREQPSPQMPHNNPVTINQQFNSDRQ